MYTKTRKLVLASAISMALASISGATLADTMSPELTSARQESQISTTYSLSPYLRSGDITVSVAEGKATLSGTVAEDIDKQLAKQIAMGVNGIKSVDNQIKVDAAYVSAARTSDERSFGEVVDDATITATIKSKLLWSKNTEGLDMDVDTRMGTVTLTGSADNGAAKELAGRMAENTRGVASVDNKLVVDKVVVDKSKATSKNEVKATGNDSTQPIADSWITTKVKSTYMFSRNVENHDISVTTKEGIVTLSGKVDSGAEQALATELALNVRGVKSVNSAALTF